MSLSLSLVCEGIVIPRLKYDKGTLGSSPNLAALPLPKRPASSSSSAFTIMNTPKTMMLGWGSLIAAAGVSYYFARKEIDARRKMQREAGTRKTEKKEWYERLGDPPPSTTKPSDPSATASPLKPPDKG